MFLFVLPAHRRREWRSERARFMWRLPIMCVQGQVFHPSLAYAFECKAIQDTHRISCVEFWSGHYGWLQHESVAFKGRSVPSFVLLMWNRVPWSLFLLVKGLDAIHVSRRGNTGEQPQWFREPCSTAEFAYRPGRSRGQGGRQVMVMRYNDCRSTMLDTLVWIFHVSA